MSTSRLFRIGEIVRLSRKRSIVRDCADVSPAFGWSFGAAGFDSEERRDDTGARLATQMRTVPELQRVDRFPRELAALENAVLRLIVVRPRPLFVDHFGEIDDVRALGLDEQPCSCFVDRRDRERVGRDARQHDEEGRRGGPAALVQHAQIIQQMSARQSLCPRASSVAAPAPSDHSSQDGACSEVPAAARSVRRSSASSASIRPWHWFALRIRNTAAGR